MPKVNHKKWSEKKEKLSGEMKKALKKDKQKLGPNLDDFDKEEKAFNKKNFKIDSKAAPKMIESLRKLKESIVDGIEKYEEVLEGDNSGEGVAAKDTLAEIRTDVENRYKTCGQSYADLRHGAGALHM